MLNKKGMTMIELLGVITLLGIILIVAIPAFSKYGTKAKNQSFDTMSKSIYEAGASKFMNDGRVIDPCPVTGANNEEELIELLKQPATNSESGEVDKTHSVLSSQCKENVNFVSFNASNQLVAQGYLEPLVSPAKDGNLCDGYVDIFKVKFADSSDLDMDYYYRVYISCPGGKESTAIYTSTNTKGSKNE